jgi:hypothetical protein
MKQPSQLRFGFLSARGEVRLLMAIKPDDIGKKPDLGGRPFAVRAID